MSSQVSNQHSFRLPVPAAIAFMFFTPAGEELWVEGWHPTYIQPPDGATRAGMVFTTGASDEFTIWQLVDFDRAELHSRYARTTPALRAGLVEVRCAPLDNGGTQVVVRYTMTALTAAGEASLDAYEGKRFVDMIEGWSAAIEQRLPLLLATQIR
jgi:hypothetical protein